MRRELHIFKNWADAHNILIDRCIENGLRYSKIGNRIIGPDCHMVVGVEESVIRRHGGQRFDDIYIHFEPSPELEAWAKTRTNDRT